jgi:putative tryptophan/tyrosine transport system substrate-binding protein
LAQQFAAHQHSTVCGFSEAMRERGWIEGRHFVIEPRHWEGRSELLPSLAAELVRLNVALIITGSSPGTTAVKNATTKIPIVFLGVGDPVASGFVTSLSRPGGNVTGFGGLGTGLHIKQLGLLREIAGPATRIGMFINPEFGFHAYARSEIEAAASERGIFLRAIEVRSPDDIDPAFAAVSRERIEALLILGQPFYYQHAPRIAKHAISQRLPTVLPFRELVRAGVLMSYGPEANDDLKRLPYLIERIVNGVKPADIPVEQPTRFYLTINAKTARAIGLSLPQSLLLRADEIIE